MCLFDLNAMNSVCWWCIFACTLIKKKKQKFKIENVFDLNLHLHIFFCFLFVFHNRHIFANNRSNMDNVPGMRRMLHVLPRYHSNKAKKIKIII